MVSARRRRRPGPRCRRRAGAPASRTCAHLGHLVGHERLAAEAGLDGHDQDHVELGEQVRVRREVGAGLERERGPRPGGADGPGQSRPGRRRPRRGRSPTRQPASAYAGAHRSGSSIIRWQSSGTGLTSRSALDDGQPEGQVGDEVVVHDVDVHPVGGRDGLELGLEVGEVGGEDRGRDQHGRHPSDPGRRGPRPRGGHGRGRCATRPSRRSQDVGVAVHAWCRPRPTPGACGPSPLRRAVPVEDGDVGR